MGDDDGKSGLVGEALQLELPQTDAGAIAAATVGGDGEAFSIGVARLAEPLPPTADAFDRERTGSGSPFRRSSRPPFLKSPTSSFFLVSTEIAGSPAAIAAFTVALMCSN